MRALNYFGNLLICFMASSALTAQTKMELVWEDNFDGNTLNMNNWNFELGDGCPNLCGWGNNERQVYTDKNHEVKDGLLIITAKKEGDLYTSTRITTKGKREFKYGRIEVRADLPLGKGLWPAFWMLGANISEVHWPLCGEIDILEYVGRAPGEIFTTVHTQSSYGNTVNTKTTAMEGIEEGFHIFGIDWTEEAIEFYVDNRVVYKYVPDIKNEATWPFDKPFYILLNMAVGGNFGGPEVDDDVFPVDYKIDYVRVYSYL